MVACCDGVECCDFVHAESYGNDLHGFGTAARSAPATAFQLGDIVTSLSLGDPGLDLFLADLGLTHANIVNEIP